MDEEGSGCDCPLPLVDDERVEMAHGGGGQRMAELLARHILPRFDNAQLAAGTDAAVIALGDQRLAFTTDSFVVNPTRFPGGDIGLLSVCGTLNDLATAGATPRWLSAALIIEEGLGTRELDSVLESMAHCAADNGVELVTGDTKVVERGRGHGIYINTTGVGVLQHDRVLAPASVRAGDAILVSGDLGRHGIAVMAAREGLQDRIPVSSDVAPIHPAVSGLLEAGIELHCIRDLTRGGLVSALVEVAGHARCGLQVREADIPVSEGVRWACELLGFDPLYVANEGRFVAFLPDAQADRALAVLQQYAVDTTPAKIGSVGAPDEAPSIVSRYGPARRLAMISGEQMPRIC